jgi:hypothetical protein
MASTNETRDSIRAFSRPRLNCEADYNGTPNPLVRTQIHSAFEGLKAHSKACSSYKLFGHENHERQRARTLPKVAAIALHHLVSANIFGRRDRWATRPQRKAGELCMVSTEPELRRRLLIKDTAALALKERLEVIARMIGGLINRLGERKA